MNFAQAFTALKRGKFIRRAAWAPGHWLKYGRANGDELERCEIYSTSTPGIRAGQSTRWHPNQNDILAEDWSPMPDMKGTNPHKTTVKKRRVRSAFRFSSANKSA